MSMSISSLRLRLIRSAQGGATQRALAMLDSEDLKTSGLNPIRNTAMEVLSLWKTREKTSALKGLVIPGVSNLNAQLSKLPSDAQVEQYNVENGSSIGSIFLDPATGEFLGDTIVKRRSKSRHMLDLETQFFHSSRKSA
jgi:hypothetical protein